MAPPMDESQLPDSMPEEKKEQVVEAYNTAAEKYEEAAILREEEAEEEPPDALLRLYSIELEEKHFNSIPAKLCLVASFIFPLSGCIYYCLATESPDWTPRGKWAKYGLYVASFLSVLYMYLLAAGLTYGAYKPTKVDNFFVGHGFQKPQYDVGDDLPEWWPEGSP